MDTLTKIDHQKISMVLPKFHDQDLISLNEKLFFTLRYNPEMQLIEFILEDDVVRTCTDDKFIRLCETIIIKKSFVLCVLNLDITDLELTAAYHLLYSLDKSVKNFDREKNSFTKKVSRGLVQEEADIASHLSNYSEAFKDKKSQMITNDDEKGPGSEKQTAKISNKYEVIVNFITNRKKIDDEKKIFSGERDDNVHYGNSVIQIPESHKSGKFEKPSIWKLEFSENYVKHITLKNLQLEDEMIFFKNIKDQTLNNDQAIIFVHGFNVTFRHGLYKAAQLKFDLGFTGPMILFSWPSKGSVIRYTHDITNAEYSSDFLSRAIEKISSLRIKEIFLISHSMGTRCMTMALKNLATKKTSIKLLETLVLAAPDIDKKYFEDNIVKSILPMVKSGVIYASDTDKALLASKLINGYNRLGDVDKDVPVFDGFDTIDATDKGKDFLKHSYITEDNRVLDDIYHFLFNKTPPGKRRLRDFHNLDKKVYWKFA